MKRPQKKEREREREREREYKVFEMLTFKFGVFSQSHDR